MRVQLKSKKLKVKSFGFTLIELLIAMAIMGILATVGLVSFRTAQMRGRDAERKSDLKQISNALELYYSDYGKYPPVPIPWGDEFKDVKETTYMKKVPVDPNGACPYLYKVSTSGKSYQLFARLENIQDKNINSGISIACGSSNYNFSITSSNVVPTTDPLP